MCNPFVPGFRNPGTKKGAIPYNVSDNKTRKECAMNILAHYKDSDPIEIHKEIVREINEIVRNTLQETMQDLLVGEFLEIIEDLRTKGEHVQKNGFYGRDFATSVGKIHLSIPRDRFSLYQTALLKPYSRTLDDLDGLIQTLYLKGLSQNDIVMQIEEMTGHSMSRITIGKVVRNMLSEAEKYRTRPIPDCPVVYLDATYVPFKTIDANGCKYVTNECIEVAIGITVSGNKMVLGYFIHPNEGKNSWTEAIQSLRDRGLKDPKLFVTDGLNGMVDAIHEVFPKAKHQRCLVHVARNIIGDVHKKDQKEIGADFKHVYAPEVTTKEEFGNRLTRFVSKWQKAYPKRMRLLLEVKGLDTYLGFPSCIRTSLYTSNQIESLNSMIKTETHKRRLINSEENGIIVMASAIVKYERKQRRIRGFTELTESEKTEMGFRLASVS